MSRVSEWQRAMADMLQRLADDVRAGRTFILKADTEAEHPQLVPLPDEEYVQSGITGRFRLDIEYAVPESEARHAREILARHATREGAKV